MKIKSITISRFRSIKDAAIAMSDFNVFVGQNNHGKTNLFEAVRWFFSGTARDESLEDLFFCRERSEPIMVTVEFTGALDGASKMKNPSNKTKILDLLKDQDTIIVRRSTADDPKKRTLIINGTEITKLPTGFDSALNDFLPKFEYINTRTYFEDVGKFSKGSPVAIMLSGVLTAILESSPEYQEFQAKFKELFGSDESQVRIELDALSNKVKGYLEKQFPDCTKVIFEVSPPVFDELLKSFETSVDDGIETTAVEKGDGMQRALMLSILQAYADFRREREDVGKSFLFFIDEAELHLHPSAQRKLKNVLLDLAKQGDQVFVNTHSSVLVVDEHNEQTAFRVEKYARETAITPITDDDKPNIVFDLLGGTPGDLLLPANFLIVEGKAEVELLTAVIARFYREKPRIQVVSAGGDVIQAERTINAVDRAFSPLERTLYGTRTTILIDRPRAEGALRNFLDNHPEIRRTDRLKQLPTGSVEEYYPDREGWRRNSAQVDTMEGHTKVQLAKRVGAGITQDEFERGMPACFEALTACWEAAFR